jgi:uncharacterized protein (UPF0333 family)
MVSKQQVSLICLILLLVLFPLVSAIPTTGAATMVGTNNATLHASGASGNTWFQFGTAEGRSNSKLSNVTPVTGAATFVWSGAVLYGNTEYYYRACDSTGCGSELSFITAVVTPIPTGTWGSYATNITENRLDPANLVWNSVQAYVSITGATIFYALIFMMLFVGSWLSTRGTAVGQQFGMICAVLFCSSLIGLGLGLPPEFVSVGQALLYISLAGAVVGFTVK